MTNENESISQLIEILKRVPNEDSFDESVDQVAGGLWLRSFAHLIREAKKHLKSMPRRMVDEEDVAVVAFNAFLTGVAEERFSNLSLPRRSLANPSDAGSP